MESYLHTLADRFAREQGEHLRDYTFVFPNRRAGLFFRQYIGRALDKPILAPEILTINDCFHSLSDLQPEDPTVTLFRLYRLYCTLQPEPEPVEQFLYWGKLLLNDFSEVDNHLTENVQGLFATIHDLHEVDLHYNYLNDEQLAVIREFWGYYLKGYRDNENSPAADDPHRRFLHIWSLLWPLYQGLRAEMLAEGKAYDGLLHRQLIDNWDNIPAERFRKHYVFIGFNALTRSEEQLLKRLRDCGIAEFCFDETDPHLSTPDITWLSVSGTLAEAHETGRILHELGTDADGAPIDWTRTAVVLPDERLLLPMLHVLPDEVDKVNVTMGYPMNVTPAFALLLHLEQLHRRFTGAGFYHRDVTALLTHRMINDIAPEACQQLLAVIRGRNLIYISERLIPEPLRLVFRRLDCRAAICENLRELFTTLPAADDTEAAARILQALNHIERLDDVGLLPDMQPNTLFTILRMLTGDQTIPYVGEPLHGLQIMGVLETRALDFDNIIIAGFNDDIYPGNSHSNSYIPLTLRRGFGLPTPERKDALLAYNFYRMLSYAKRVWLITDSRADERHSGEASRYLAQLQMQYGVPVRTVHVMPETAILRPAETAVNVSDEGRQRLQELADPEGTRGISPSAINTWLDCRRRFYWRFVAGLHEPDNVDEEVSEADFGTALHAVMEQLYKPLCGQTVTAADIETLEQRVEAEWVLWDFLDPIRRSTLAENALRQYVHLLLERDRKEVPFTYICSELSQHRILTLDDGTRVRLCGTIDRIDQKDGAERLIDYKSGKAETEFADVASLFDADNKTRNRYALQTLLYCLLREDTALPVQPHIFSVRNTDDEPTMVRLKGSDSFDFDALRNEFTTCLRETLSDMLRADTFPQQTTDPHRCDYCPFASLCQP